MSSKSYLLVAVLLAACGDADGGDGGDSANATSSAATADDSGATAATADDTAGSEAPSPESTSACRDVCDDLLQFDCVDVDLHMACFEACGVRSDDEIELFRSCWLNTPTCAEDPAPAQECVANFLDTDDPTPDPPAPGGNCLDACNAYVGGGCQSPIEGIDSCQEFCDMLPAELQDFAVMCLEDADGCTLPADCQFPGG